MNGLRLTGHSGLAVPRPSCNCDVLPWEDCEHTAWDSGKTIDRVIEEAEEFHLTAPVQSEVFKTALPERPPIPLDVLMVLARCRKVVERDIGRGGRRYREARRLISDIDAITPRGFPA